MQGRGHVTGCAGPAVEGFPGRRARRSPGGSPPRGSVSSMEPGATRFTVMPRGPSFSREREGVRVQGRLGRRVRDRTGTAHGRGGADEEHASAGRGEVVPQRLGDQEGGEHVEPVVERPVAGEGREGVASAPSAPVPERLPLVLTSTSTAPKRSHTNRAASRRWSGSARSAGRATARGSAALPEDSGAASDEDDPVPVAGERPRRGQSDARATAGHDHCVPCPTPRSERRRTR